MIKPSYIKALKSISIVSIAFIFSCHNSQNEKSDTKPVSKQKLAFSKWNLTNDSTTLFSLAARFGILDYDSRWQEHLAIEPLTFKFGKFSFVHLLSPGFCNRGKIIPEEYLDVNNAYKNNDLDAAGIGFVKSRNVKDSASDISFLKFIFTKAKPRILPEQDFSLYFNNSKWEMDIHDLIKEPVNYENYNLLKNKFCAITNVRIVTSNQNMIADNNKFYIIDVISGEKYIDGYYSSLILTFTPSGKFIDAINTGCYTSTDGSYLENFISYFDSVKYEINDQDEFCAKYHIIIKHTNLYTNKRFYYTKQQIHFVYDLTWDGRFMLRSIDPVKKETKDMLDVL